MRSEELNNEIAGLISRLQHVVRTDSFMPIYLMRDDEQNSENLVLHGLEQAIIGLVMLHIQLRRKL